MTKFDTLYMLVAELNAQMSKDERALVGAAFVNNDRILSTGWNGTAPGEDNKCQDENGVTLPTVIHAEMNAIYKAARDGQSLNGSTLYCTNSPCKTCARALHSVGIARLVFSKQYRDTEGIEFLIDRGVQVDVMSNWK